MIIIDKNIIAISLNKLVEGEIKELCCIGWGKNQSDSNSVINDLINYLNSRLDGLHNKNSDYVLDLLDNEDSIIDNYALTESQAKYIFKLNKDTSFNKNEQRLWRITRTHLNHIKKQSTQ